MYPGGSPVFVSTSSSWLRFGPQGKNVKGFESTTADEKASRKNPQKREGLR